MNRNISGIFRLPAAAAALVMSTAAHSQDTASDTESAEPLEEIVVTGSRIARRDYSADSPIVTVDQEAITAHGPATLEAVLNELPQFAALRPGSSISSGRGGRNNANLRGLGIGRTLVLLDGRRMQPSDLNGAIDLNTVPKSLIESMEVVTGGASAAYGSDAIAGVLNLKLRQRFEGAELYGRYALTDHNDAGSTEVGLLMGTNLAGDRGNAILSVSYLDRDFAPRGNREFFRDKDPSTLLIGGVIQSDGTNLPDQDVINDVFANYGITGLTVPRNANLGVNEDGTLFTTNATSTVPILNLRYGDPPYFLAREGSRVGQHHGIYFPLQQAMEKTNVFGKFTYDLTDSVSFYGQALAVRYSSRHELRTTGMREPLIPITNSFIPDDLMTVLQSRPEPDAPLIYWYGRAKLDFRRTTDEYQVDQIVAGFNGEFEQKGWTWDVYASYGDTQNWTSDSTNADRAALTELLNAPDGGRSVCPGGYDPFRAVALADDPDTIDCFNYVNRPTQSFTEFSQTVLEGTLQGGAFQLPAGEVMFAVGAGYRKNTFADRPSDLAVGGYLIGTEVGESVRREGSDDVSEVFAELLVPVLADKPLVQHLDLTIGGRYSDYDSIGGVTTYMASGEWRIADPVSIRGSFQRAIRAPNLDELYPEPGIGGVLLGQVASGGGDPCDVNSIFRQGASAQQIRDLCVQLGVPSSLIDIFQFSGSAVETFTPPGSEIEEEVADTYSAGVVLSSTFDQPVFSDMSLSIDYYNIELTGAIGTITGPVTINLCFNSNGGSNPGYSAANPFCEQIQRDSGGRIVRINTPRLNLAAYETSGIDVQFDWNVGLEDMGISRLSGNLDLNLVVSYVDEYTIQNLEGEPFVNYAGTIGNNQIDAWTYSHPEWKVMGSLTFNTGPLSLRVGGRWIDGMFNSTDASSDTRSRPGVPSKAYFDVTGTWDFARYDMTLQFGSLNVGDTQPPAFDVSGSTDLGLYDILGRRYFASVTKRF